MKPAITKLKNMRGRITGYRATLGQIERDAPTVTEAIEACERDAMVALNHGGAVCVMHDLYPDASGVLTTWILEHRYGAWSYRMARPMRPGSHYDGQSSCGLNVATRIEAEDCMRRHWYQNNVEPFALAVYALGQWARSLSEVRHAA